MLKKFLLYSLIWLSLILSFNVIGSDVFAQFEGGSTNTQEKATGEDVGINLSKDCVSWVWTWCFSYDKLIRWSKSELVNKNKDRTVMTIVQDVIFAATYMVWTVLTIILLYCWLMYIFASWSGKEPSEYKTWLKKAAIWAILVWWAYAIVRLIQYIAKW